MDWMNLVGGLVQQYAGGTAAAPAQSGQVEEHYDQVAQTVPCDSLAGALASAFRSDQTPGFGQIASQLFGNSGGNQQASMLNTLLATAGPALLGGALSSGKMPNLASMLGDDGQPRQLTPEEASQIPPEEIQHLAAHVEKHDPSIVDRVSEIYAEHPAIVKSLGGAAMSLAMAELAKNMQHR